MLLGFDSFAVQLLQDDVPQGVHQDTAQPQFRWYLGSHTQHRYATEALQIRVKCLSRGVTLLQHSTGCLQFPLGLGQFAEGIGHCIRCGTGFKQDLLAIAPGPLRLFALVARAVSCLFCRTCWLAVILRQPRCAVYKARKENCAMLLR